MTPFNIFSFPTMLNLLILELINSTHTRKQHMNCICDRQTNPNQHHTLLPKPSIPSLTYRIEQTILPINHAPTQLTTRSNNITIPNSTSRISLTRSLLLLQCSSPTETYRHHHHDPYYTSKKKKTSKNNKYCQYQHRVYIHYSPTHYHRRRLFTALPF